MTTRIEKYILVSKINLSHNVIELVVERMDSGVNYFPVSSHVYIFSDDCETKRPYTPLSTCGGRLTFAVKVYKNGTISKMLGLKRVSDVIYISTPQIRKLYDFSERKVAMIAGGTGITPMLQIMSADSTTEFTLFFCNLAVNDIFLMDRLYQFPNCRVINIIENKMGLLDGQYGGRITKSIISDNLEDINSYFFYICGPPAFNKYLYNSDNDAAGIKELGILQELGIGSNKIYKF